MTTVFENTPVCKRGKYSIIGLSWKKGNGMPEKLSFVEIVCASKYLFGLKSKSYKIIMP